MKIGQLRSEFTNFFNFSPYPNMHRSLDEVATQEGDDDIHVSLSVMDDFSQAAPSMETIVNAHKSGFSRLHESIAKLG